MKDFQIILAAISSVILFVFGLENFSKEVQNITGEKFRKFLGSATMYPVVGLLIGAIITALIQSSSATSVIAISLVNAGVMSFKNSVGIIFGANVGTTVTAQLVAFKLTAFAPVFIIIGFLLSFTRSRYAIFGKTLFYFGFVFFSLNLISSALSPLQTDARLIEFLTRSHNPLLGVLVGAVITAVVQSSSVTTGLAIIFTQQGLMSLDNAIPILMGSNLGTTVTALISIINMDIAAKKTALAHFLFNLGGVLIFLPIVIFWGDRMPLMSDVPAIALANFHLIFNVTTSFIFVIFLTPFTALIDRMLGEGKMDFERIALGLKEESDFSEIEKNLMDDLEKTFQFVQENYNLVTLSIETNYKGIYEAAKKRIDYMDFLKAELLGFFSKFISKCNNEEEVDRIVNIMAMYEYIFQMHDSVKDITSVKVSMDNNYIELKSDVLMIVREIASSTLSVFDYISNDGQKEKDLKKVSQDFQRNLEGFGKKVFTLMAKPERNDAGAIMHLLTYSQRLKDKLMNYYHLREGRIAP
ncbi:Na/Pi symporter [Halobacteriovorax sp. ZH4_bin.1]|uniref:Na/Pi cotransporter family protein n=1 Tax=unclassified Halobacteriovorax TaxID=2639665 RepID=UPI00371DFF33